MNNNTARNRIDELERFLETGLANDPMVEIRISVNGRAIQVDTMSYWYADVYRFTHDGRVSNHYTATPRSDWPIVKAYGDELDV